jgi:hypothetical protein
MRSSDIARSSSASKPERGPRRKPRAVTIATHRYARGLTEYLNVLDATIYRRCWRRSRQYIALYRALGGDSELYQDISAGAVAQPAIVATFRQLCATP